MAGMDVALTGAGDAACAGSRLTIKVGIDCTDSDFTLNASGEYVVTLQDRKQKLTTAFWGHLDVPTRKSVMKIGAGVAVICAAFKTMGFIATSFRPGSLYVDLDLDKDRETSVRRKLQRGDFLKDLVEETTEILQKYREDLHRLKDFKIHSCEEVQSEKEGRTDRMSEYHNVNLTDAAVRSTNVAIVEDTKKIEFSMKAPTGSSNRGSGSGLVMTNATITNASVDSENVLIQKSKK